MENATASFAYDALNRLSTAEERDGKRYAYEYDASGNRTSTTVRDRTSNAVVESESYSYDARNRVEMYMDASGMPRSFSYDANGNVTEDVNGGYVYDAFNRLTTHVELQSGQYKETHYAYNGDGQRVSKTDAGNVSTYYQYDYDKVVLEQKSTGEVTRNTYGLSLISRSTGKVQEKSLNANMSVKVSYNETLYYQYNGHADVTRLSDASGIEKASYTYDAFGNVLESTGTEHNPYRYAGYTYDEESSLYYLNARYYNPKTARLQAVDPHWNSENMIYGDNPRTINTMQNPIIEQSFVTAEIEPYVVDEELKVLRIKTNENVPEQGADQRTEQAEKQDGITVPDARAIIQSSNLYVYCGNDPVRYTDPNGEDAIVITNSNLVPVLGEPQGHTSSVYQDDDGNWYYCYWGDKAAAVIQIPDKYMGSLEDFNKGLNAFLSDNGFSNISSDYTDATYVVEDFSESLDAAYEDVYTAASDIFSDGELTGLEDGSLVFQGHNSPYNVAYRNCLDKTYDSLSKGTLANGKNAGDYMKGLGFEGGLIPNKAKPEFANAFMNSSFTKGGAYEGAKKHIRAWEEGRPSAKKWAKANYAYAILGW